MIFLRRYDIYHKGVDRLLLLAREIQALDDQVHISLYGKGPNAAKIKELMIAYRLKNVSINAPVYNADKETAIRRASVYLHTARWAAFGRSIAEAMMPGKTCIISDSCYLANDVFNKFDLDLVIGSEPWQSRCSGCATSERSAAVSPKW